MLYYSHDVIQESLVGRLLGRHACIYHDDITYQAAMPAVLIIQPAHELIIIPLMIGIILLCLIQICQGCIETLLRYAPHSVTEQKQIECPGLRAGLEAQLLIAGIGKIEFPFGIYHD